MNQATSSTLTETACGSYTLNGQTYTSTGTYIQTLTNAQGCDSTITLNLTIPVIDNTITTLNGLTFTANQAGASYQWVYCNGNAPIIEQPGSRSHR